MTILFIDGVWVEHPHTHETNKRGLFHAYVDKLPIESSIWEGEN